MASDWQNPCGGTRWRTLDDGTIEVEGQGVPTFSAAGAKNLALTWSYWQDLINAAAARDTPDLHGGTHKLPPSWILAIIYNETGFLAPRGPNAMADVVSGDGYGSVGLMQPLPATAHEYGGYSIDEMTDPAKNIDVGTRLLAELLRMYPDTGFPPVAAKFNAGHLCNPGNDQFNLGGYKGNYATDAILGNNTAILALGVSGQPGGASAGPSKAAMGIGLALAGVGAAIAIVIWPK